MTIETIEEAMRKSLENAGLHTSHVDQVIAICKGHKMCKPLEGRWQRDVHKEPAVVIGALWLNVKAVAYAWATRQDPAPWYLRMLEPSKKAVPAQS